MKKLIFILALFVVGAAFTTTTNDQVSIVTTQQSDFCKGWVDGWCEGWKDVKGQYAVCPVAPICPIPNIGQDTYKGGYNRGFKAGSRAAQDN